MSYKPYSKNIIIQENFDALDEEIKEVKKGHEKQAICWRSTGVKHSN